MSFIRVPKIKVQHLARTKMAEITKYRESMWRERIDRLNAKRARRWFGSRKPLDDEAAKAVLLERGCGIDWYADMEYERAAQLLELTFADTVDRAVHISCEDYAMLKGVG